MIKKSYLFFLFVLFILLQHCYSKIIDKSTEVIKENHKMEYGNEKVEVLEISHDNKVLIIEEPKTHKKKEEK